MTNPKSVADSLPAHLPASLAAAPLDAGSLPRHRQVTQLRENYAKVKQERLEMAELAKTNGVSPAPATQRAPRSR